MLLFCCRKYFFFYLSKILPGYLLMEIKRQLLTSYSFRLGLIILIHLMLFKKSELLGWALFIDDKNQTVHSNQTNIQSESSWFLEILFAWACASQMARNSVQFSNSQIIVHIHITTMFLRSIRLQAGYPKEISFHYHFVFGHQSYSQSNICLECHRLSFLFFIQTKKNFF